MNNQSEIKPWDGIQEHCAGWQCITFHALFQSLAQRWGTRTAVCCEGESLTYEELLAASESLAAEMLERGLKKGDHVIFQMPNCLEFLPSLLALMIIGAVPAMVLPAHGMYELSGIAALLQPVGCISTDSFQHPNCTRNAAKLLEQYDSIRLHMDGEALRRGMESKKKLILQEKPVWTDIALLLLSGGTSGIPKLIPRTHGDYIYDSSICAERCGLNQESVFLSVLPSEHNFALANPGILGTLQNGGKVVFCDSPSPIEITDAVETEGVTFTALVPALLDNLIRYRMISDEEDLSSLQFVMTGGAMLPQETAQNAEPVLCCRLLQIYGTAEGLNCCHSPNAPYEERLASQGPPISPYDEIRILDEDGRPVPAGTEGEMITRGPYTIRGYYRNPEANKRSFTPDGFYRTGDRAVLSPEGYLRITGRCMEQINRAGEKIMPTELEDLIRSYEPVSDCAVCGIPDPVCGSRIAAFITASVPISKKQITAYLKQCGCAPYKLPDEVIQRKALLYTAVGKPDKKNLVKEWMQEHEQADV